MKLQKVLLLSLVGVGLLFGSTDGNSSSTKGDYVKVTGIRQAPLTADSQNLPNIKENDNPPMPGKTKPIPKAFVTAPPMIPHSIKGMVPIKVGKNQCLSCHDPKMAKTLKITPIPPSHFVDNFKGGKKEKKLAGSRYFCTTCHVPQAQVDPVIENKFETIKKSQKK
jgi:cytochrome c-type protein NapB